MRKKTKFNYEVAKHLFDEGVATEDDSSYFRVNGGPEPIFISLPTSIVHRLFRLAQAYNIRQLRFLESNVKLVIGTYELPEFVKDLERLKKLVNDEVLHHYANTLLEAIKSEPGPSAKHIAVSTGDFYPGSA
ncbi:hypothetical protein LP417_09970 [Polaromonas sp. P1-6]|nr:hypothetical protein LP417_09970 [Polaromonas sp. P1-6]